MKQIYLILLVLLLISCKTKAQESNMSEYKVPKEEMITYGLTSNLIMNENEFWEIISQSSNQGRSKYKNQTEALKAILINLDESTLIKFANTFYTLENGSYNMDLWSAAYVINGGCSDDCFDYFREYLISKGKSKFYSTLKNPDSCADWILSEGQENWQGIGTIPIQVYKERTGKDLKLSIPPKKDINAEDFDELTLGAKYPKLAAKFGY